MARFSFLSPNSFLGSLLRLKLPPEEYDEKMVAALGLLTLVSLPPMGIYILWMVYCIIVRTFQ